MNTPKDSAGGCCPPPPCSADPFLEEISDKIRRGEPVGIMEALAAIEYQRQRKQQEPPTLWKRVVRFFLPKLDLILNIKRTVTKTTPKPKPRPEYSDELFHGL